MRREPKDTGGDPLELAPLRGLRYATPDARALIDTPAFNVALALAPPYDMVDAASLTSLLRAEPLNAALLTVPPSAAEAAGPAEELTGPGRYQAAARTLHRWISTGVLVRDPDPAIYVYEQTAPDGGRQRGLIGALRLPAGDGPAVRPHEDVAPGPVVDRAELMAATRANLEPIFLLYRGGTGTARGAASQITDRVAGGAAEPLTDTVTADGTTHRLWAVTDPGLQADIAADLARRTALIADGHHRYAAYRRLRDRRPGPGPWDHGLALLVDSDSSPPRVDAIHRVLRGIDPDAAVRAAEAEQVARVERLPWSPAEAHGLRSAVDALAEAARPGPALLVAGAGADDGLHLLRGFDDRRLADAAPDRSPQWRALPTAVLDRLLLPLWGPGEGRVDLVHADPAAAVAAARPGSDTAVILPALAVDDVYALTSRGELTPRKSTSFGPKPRTGLVIRAFAPSEAPPRP
ncbi:DUF1015 domain-containing protein [Nocardiopsis sediminis]|uniref:DUF1015 domain-containing protein n=1 Tax=Nocardiopsis sediminis TaxID=1778267 RepID=A0ABV8FGP9_9ACTN